MTGIIHKIATATATVATVVVITAVVVARVIVADTVKKAWSTVLNARGAKELGIPHTITRCNMCTQLFLLLSEMYQVLFKNTRHQVKAIAIAIAISEANPVAEITLHALGPTIVLQTILKEGYTHT